MFLWERNSISYLLENERLPRTAWMVCFFQSSMFKSSFQNESSDLLFVKTFFCLSLLANPWTFPIFNMPEISNAHEDHRPLYEFCVSITPKPEQKTSRTGTHFTFRFHLMWPHHDEGLTWLKLRALLSILLCWANSQFNNKTRNKKRHQQPTMLLAWTKPNLILSSCFVMIKLKLR